MVTHNEQYLIMLTYYRLQITVSKYIYNKWGCWFIPPPRKSIILLLLGMLKIKKKTKMRMLYILRNHFLILSHSNFKTPLPPAEQESPYDQIHKCIPHVQIIIYSNIC